MEMNELIINKLGEIPSNPDSEKVFVCGLGRVEIEEYEKDFVRMRGKQTRTEVVIPKDASLLVWERARSWAWFSDPRDSAMFDVEMALTKHFPDRDTNHSKGGPEDSPTSIFFSLDEVWVRISFVDELNLFKIEEWGEGDGTYYATDPQNVIDRIERLEALWLTIKRKDAEARFWKRQNAESKK